jgi:hypothetical protein
MDNYFNYFTEIERHYQSKRASFTLLSTLDWVLIETWKDQGIPLETVLKGIDRAFSRARRRISSLAYCSAAVSEVVDEQKDLRTEEPEPPAIEEEQIRAYLERLADQIRSLGPAFPEFSKRLEAIAASVAIIDASNLRSGESTLNALEEKLLAILKIAAEEDLLVQVGDEVQRSLAPFRSKMTVEQLSMLEQPPGKGESAG